MSLRPRMGDGVTFDGADAGGRIVGYFPASLERICEDAGELLLMHHDRAYVSRHTLDRVWTDQKEAELYLRSQRDAESDFNRPLPWKMYALVELPEADA